MAIQDDWTIDYVDRKITHTSGTTVYSANALYSWLADTFDELVQLDDKEPMSAQTPTAYTMINGWFIDDESIKFLDGGAITTSGWTGGEIRQLTFQAGGYTNAVAGDIGKSVVGTTTTDSGNLLAYDNTRRVWWVRPDDVATDLFDQGEAFTITTGTGAGTTPAASTTGEALWTNLYTLGSIEAAPSPQIYVFQNTGAIAEWWSAGQIDVLVKVREVGSLIDSGLVTVYARQFGDLYDHFPIDLSAGGRQAAPLATANDLNDTTGSHYLLYDAETAAFNVGATLASNNADPGSAEIYGVTDNGTVGILEIGNIKGTFADNDTLSDNGTVPGGGTQNGTAADVLVLYDNEGTTGFAVGNTVTGGTSGATGTVRGLQDDGTTGVLVIESTNYIDYDNDEELQVSATREGDANGDASRLVSGFDDIAISFVSGTLAYDTQTVAFTAGQTLTGGTSGATGVILFDSVPGVGDGILALGNVVGRFQDNETITDEGTGSAAVNGSLEPDPVLTKAFTQGTLEPYNVIVDCAARPLAEVYRYFKFVTGEDSTFQTYALKPDSFDYVKQDDGTVFTDNTTAASSTSGSTFSLLPATAALNDAVYFGSVDDEFLSLDLNTTVAATGTYTITWEYWNGAWTALTGVVDNTTGFQSTGVQDVFWTRPTDWAATTVDSASAFWVRARVSAYTSGGGGTAEYAAEWNPPDALDGEFYISANDSYAPVKQSPFGSFAGGTLFGARGVWVENMASADSQSFQLLDADGDTNNPPNFQDVTVSNLVSGDRVFVARDDGAGNVLKTQFTMTSQGSSSPTVVIQEVIPNDTPSAGFIRVVDDADGLEQRYEYTSWSVSTFTLSGTTSRAYDTNDTAYVPYIDRQTATTEEAETVIYVSDRTVVARVRRYNGAGDTILPFEATGTLSATGFSVNTIRVDDNIVS